MKIAVMSDRADLQGRVPDAFEAAEALLVIETDTETLCAAAQGGDPGDFVERILRGGWEAVVCGSRIGQACFDPLADAGVTRYAGAGLSVVQAAVLADRGKLPLIPEFEGGPGCGSGAGACSHSHEDPGEES